MNFGLAQKYGGKTNLRFDDTNPVVEDTEYVDSIMHDVQWLGFTWEGQSFFASDYFQQLYDWAVHLIKEGKAYVDDSTLEEVRAMRGVPISRGIESPFRERSVEENLSLFTQMKDGAFDEGAKILGAKIDMSSPNMHMRDSIMYCILNALTTVPATNVRLGAWTKCLCRRDTSSCLYGCWAERKKKRWQTLRACQRLFKKNEFEITYCFFKASTSTFRASNC